MYIKRDLTALLLQSHARIQILMGPRQCGKSTLFASLYTNSTKNLTELTFDDLQLRELANTDPALFLQQFEPPLLLDEVQYVPNLFPELKKKIDALKREAVFKKQKLTSKPLYHLTGSNQILMDKQVKETLTGRASYFLLNTLTVHEVLATLPNTPLKDILFKGGWPELHTTPELSVTTYLNDYIRTYVEKDIMLSAGIQKMSEFLTVLRLCAARTAQETHYSDLQQDSGVSAVTIKEWIGLLERTDLLYLLPPLHNNLNKRLIKRSKLYFMDTGLATRLQGWSESLPLLNSPQIGFLFKTLVVTEIIKFIRNYGKDWEIFFWRTKDGQEIDIVIKTARGTHYAFEVKYAVHGISRPLFYPPAYKHAYQPTTPLVVVCSGGKKIKLSSDCLVIPISELHDYLQEID